MAVIAPAVLAADPHEFREQMERIAPFASRVQIDLTDGHFAKAKTIELGGVWWLKTVAADLHLMYKNPSDYLGTIIRLAPSLVIVHAEAHGDFLELAEKLRNAGIKVGVALLPDTAVEKIRLSLQVIDHALIFSGNLGHFGGKADLMLLEKAKELRKLKPNLEIGWDGGINEENVKQLAEGGVDVLNVGGYIQKAKDPEAAYGKLKKKIESVSGHEAKINT